MRSIRANLKTVICIIIGLVFICIGIADGQHMDVLNKAVRICLECIGIG